MEKLKDVINVTGQSIDEMILTPPEGMSIEDYRNDLMKKVSDKVNPQVQAYVDGLNVPTLVQSAITVEELEQMEFTYLTDELKTAVVQAVDELEVTITEKTYLFALTTTEYLRQISTFINQHMHQRASQIMKPVRRIIT